MILAILLIVGLLVVSGTFSILWILFMAKRRTMNPLARGPRYRDGIVSYNQFEGIRFNLEIEDPRELRSSRYRRRHSSTQRKQKKPWMQ